MTRDEIMEWLQHHQRHCPCGAVHTMTDVHHVFFRRVKKGMDELYHPANVVAANNRCHLEEGREFQIESALLCFEHVGGPDKVLEWVDTLPLKIKTLPAHYWEARERWLAEIDNDS